jgi:hypothetical protein
MKVKHTETLLDKLSSLALDRVVVIAETQWQKSASDRKFHQQWVKYVQKLNNRVEWKQEMGR